MEVPGFKIEKTIGKGGMARVYLARQESLGRLVVLKTLNTEESESESYTGRFLNEARIIASLRHPHIITIYDVGTTTELLYIAMEYVDGGVLDARIESGIAPLEALGILIKIAGALDFAHREGVIHRDVKPQNILFRRDGTPVLSDFGIAKQMTVDTDLTATGTILGSPHYMSPEQAEGLNLDGRTDIYSLGMIFYEMLTGRKPYMGDSAIKVLMQQLQGPVPALPEELSRFQALLERMVTKDRDERFPGAVALIEYAERMRRAELAASGGAAPSPGTQGGSATPSASGSASGSSSGEGATATRPAVPRERGHKSAWVLAGLLGAVLVGFGAFYAYTESLETSGIVPSRPSERSPQVLAQAARADEGRVDASHLEAVAKDAVQAAEATPEPLRRDVVTALEWLAENSLKDGRLTYPPADNAHYYYSRLLALDPDNRRAVEGFHRIAERYVVLAEQEYAEKDYREAQAYITLGLQVQPDNEGLLTLQGLIASKERSWFESLVDFVTGRTG